MSDRDSVILQILNSGILCNDCGENTASYCAEAIVDLLNANGMRVQRWVPVTERLPEVGKSVIAYNASAKCAAEAVYKGEGKFLQFRWAARLQEQEVTHWMPLPTPPKDGDT